MATNRYIARPLEAYVRTDWEGGPAGERSEEEEEWYNRQCQRQRHSSERRTRKIGGRMREGAHSQ